MDRDEMFVGAEESIDDSMFITEDYAEPPETQSVLGTENSTMGSENVPDIAGGTDVAVTEDAESTEVATGTRRKKSKLPVVIAVGVLAVAGVGIGNRFINNTTPPPVEADMGDNGYVPAYINTRKYALDTFKELVNNYDKTGLQEYLQGSTSYIALEWDYTNNNEQRRKLLKSMCSYFDIVYPEGDEDVDNENCKVKVLDFDKLSAMMEQDVETIREMYLKSGYKETDYRFGYEMTDLMIEYVLNHGNLPTREVVISVPMVSNQEANADEEGNTYYVDNWVVTSDAEVDRAMFSSDEFHNMMDTFSKVAIEWEATRKEKQEGYVDNPKYVAWLNKRTKLVNYYEKKGKAYPDPEKLYKTKGKSKKLVKKKGKYVEIPRPEVKIIKTEVVEVENVYEHETVIPYTWIGSYYCLHEYNGKGGVIAQFGDGTQDLPAGVGTEIVTKAIDIYGVAHDVKVTLTGYWVGKDAVDYALRFSEQNRGLEGDSLTTLMCYEVRIENLEDKAFTLDCDVCLADKNGNQSSRTGKMFGFTSQGTIPPHESIMLQDWVNSPDMRTKYLIWGKSFRRQFDLVWFNLLAGDKSNIVDSDEDLRSYNLNSVVDEEPPTEDDTVDTEETHSVDESTESTETDDSTEGTEQTVTDAPQTDSDMIQDTVGEGEELITASPEDSGFEDIGGLTEGVSDSIEQGVEDIEQSIEDTEQGVEDTVQGIDIGGIG